MVRQGEVADGAAVGDPLALLQAEQIDDRPAAAVAGRLRQIVDLSPIDLALVREEHQVGVRAGHEEMLDRIFLFGLGPGQPLAAAVLGPIGRDGRPLDVAVAADRDDHRLLGDQVLKVDLADLLAADFRPPRLGILLLQLLEVLADDVEDVVAVGKDAIVFDGSWPATPGARR